MLFKQKYRIESTRIPEYDYSSSGCYFVTVCTKGKICCLSEIQNTKVILTEAGKILQEEIENTEKIRSNVEIPEYVIMPNHFHLIIQLEKEDNTTLGMIIGQIKSISTKRIKMTAIENFAWQERFYEHVIRNEKSYQKIAEYIINNPMNWEIDENYSEI